MEFGALNVRRPNACGKPLGCCNVDSTLAMGKRLVLCSWLPSLMNWTEEFHAQ